MDDDRILRRKVSISGIIRELNAIPPFLRFKSISSCYSLNALIRFGFSVDLPGLEHCRPGVDDRPKALECRHLQK